MAEALRRDARGVVGLRIGPIAEQDEAVSALASALWSRGWQIGRRRLGQCFEILVPESLAQFHERSGGMIKRTRYYERRMRRTGQVVINEFRATEVSFSRWSAALEDGAAIERNSWVYHSNGQLRFTSNKDKVFWSRVVGDEFFASKLALWIMYFDEQPIAFSLVLDSGERQFILANLYDEGFNAHSPGHVLAYHVISRAIGEGRKVIDWGMGDSGYKERWGAKPGQVLYDLLALPPGHVGRIARFALERYSNFAFE